MWSASARLASAEARRSRGFTINEQRKGRMLLNEPGKSMKPGGGGRFQKLRDAIARKGNVSDPDAVAAALGREKYGKKQFAKFSATGRRRAAKGKKG